MTEVALDYRDNFLDPPRCCKLTHRIVLPLTGLLGTSLVEPPHDANAV
ncbi:hypothetical protein AGR7C_pTi0052 [Agrobacterium deltaense Zutra 3/1]|uniref:Uncharacterized protein n=1 Tax=Agrobacterium deltaense Zutra 3/1 TaxID=1183427 RepID=A0A1S7S5A4_9HYPH|nr:hypothetical protein AGR7C_pTi0052 [Agrobacterium deltaense Zutra 3/1]